MDTRAHPEPSSVRLAGTLGLAGMLSGVAIVSVFEVTSPMIASNQARALEQAVLEVVPGAERIQRLVAIDGGLVPSNAEGPTLHATYVADGRFLGYAISGEGPGFQDTIRLIYGYDPARGRIVGMKVLESRETPGLGDKIYKDPAFARDFERLAPEPRLVLVKGGGTGAENEVHAITGATISSKAVVDIIDRTHREWKPRLPTAGSEPGLVEAKEQEP